MNKFFNKLWLVDLVIAGVFTWLIFSETSFHAQFIDALIAVMAINISVLKRQLHWANTLQRDSLSGLHQKTNKVLDNLVAGAKLK